MSSLLACVALPRGAWHIAGSWTLNESMSGNVTYQLFSECALWSFGIMRKSLEEFMDK